MSFQINTDHHVDLNNFISLQSIHGEDLEMRLKVLNERWEVIRLL